MGLDTSEVRVAGAGHVFVAPEGTVLPTDPTTPMGAEWVDLGYVTTDGVTFTFSRETEDLDAWQGDKIRVLSAREPMSLSYALMQTSADVMVVAMGGGQITSPESDVFLYTPTAGENLVRAMVIEFSDADIDYRYLVPKVQIEGDVAYTLTRDGALTYPLEFGVLDGSPKYQIVSNDPAMGGGTLPGTPGAPTLPNPPTGITTGVPGSFTPGGSDVPADLAALQALGDLGQTLIWGLGEYVVLGDASSAHWDGTAFVTGVVPDVITDVIAGSPGAFYPVNATLPADLATLQGLGSLGEVSAWTTGQSVVLDDASSAHWDGATWTVGTAT